METPYQPIRAMCGLSVVDNNSGLLIVLAIFSDSVPNAELTIL